MRFSASASLFSLCLAIGLCLGIPAFSVQAASSNNLLARAAQLNEPPPELIRGLRTAEPDQISHYATWLDWLERSPQRLGRVNYRNEPLIAGSRQNIEVSFVAGTDIQPGGLLLVATHWLNGSLLQSVDPRAGNYVSARTSSVDLLPTQTVLRGVFGGRLAGRPVPAFEVTGAGLKAGETVTFQIQNLQVPGRAGDFYLPVYFSAGPNQAFFSSPLTNLMIRPGQLASIEVTAPSRLGRGEAANVQVILQDQFGNPIQAALPSLDIIVDGVFLRRFEPTGARSEVSGIEFTESGIHSIEVRTGGGSSRGISNPIVVQSGTRQIRWADLNQQTILAQSPARQVLNLDYRLRSFHGDDIDIQSKQKLGADAVQIFDGGLRGGGSRLVFAQFDDVDNWRDLPNEMQMALPLVPTDDRTIDSQKLQLVEMVSGDSVYEWFANRLFQSGYRLGLTGSGHSLLAPIGPYPRSALTAIVASGNQSTESALQQKSTYVTTGNRMVLYATVNGAQPGRRISSSQSRSIEGWVQGTAGIERIELVKNGVVVETLNVAGDLSSPHLKVTVRSDSAQKWP